MGKGFRCVRDKDLKNRHDISNNGLKLPYKKSDVEANCENEKIYFVDEEYISKLKAILAERK